MRALPLAGLLALATPASAGSGRSGWGGELQYDLLGLDQSTNSVLAKGEPLDDANAEGTAAAARFASRLRLAQDRPPPETEMPALVLKPEAPLRLPSLADTAAHPDAPPDKPLSADSERAHVAADDDPLQAVEREIDSEDLSPRAHLAAVATQMQASKAKAAAPDASLPTRDRGGALADLAGDLAHREKLAENVTHGADSADVIKELNDFDEDEAKDPTPDVGKMSAAEAAEQAKFDKEEAEERKLDEDPDADPAPVEEKAEAEEKAEDSADGLQALAQSLGKSAQDDKATAAHQAYVAKEAHQARLAKEAREKHEEDEREMAEEAREKRQAEQKAAKPVEKALRTGHA